MAEYFTRLSLAISSGEERNSILVLEPTTTAWMYQMVVWRGDKQDYVTEPSRLKELGDQFFQLGVGAFQGPGGIRHRQRGHHCPKRLGRRPAIRHRTTKVHHGRPAAVYRESEREDDRAVGEIRHRRAGRCSVAAIRRRWSMAGRRIAPKRPPPAGLEADGACGGDFNACRSGPGRFSRRARFESQRHSLPSAPPPRGRGTGLLGQHQSRCRGLRLGDFAACRLSSDGTWKRERPKPYRASRGEQGMRIPFTLPPCGSLLLFLAKTPQDQATASRLPRTDRNVCRHLATGPTARWRSVAWNPTC